MRAVFVLAAILSLALPGVSARAIELQSPISVTLSLKAPAAQLPDHHRVSGKTDHPLSVGVVPRTYSSSPAISKVDVAATPAHEPPSLDRHGPPLAPRPPPLN